MDNEDNIRRDTPRKLIAAGILVLTIVVAVVPVLLVQYYQMRRESRQVSVVFVSKRLDPENGFWSSVEEGMQMAGTEYNIEITMMGPESETMIDEQNAMIMEAIEMSPDAIILAPNDTSLTLACARRVEAAGIKLILLDSVMEEDAGMGVVSTDNKTGGCKMGEYLKEYADADAVIGIVRHRLTSSTAIERESGIRKGLEEFEGQIVEVVYCDSDIDKAFELTMQMLKEHPDMNMIAGLNEDAARGAANAVKEAGKSDEIRLVGFDSSVEQLVLLEEGVFDAIVVQRPLNMGYLGMKMAYEAVIQDVIPEKYVDSGSVLITESDIYTKENEKLLFPFRQEE